MLIDATHPEETRVVVLNGKRLEEYDVETASKKQIKSNIYLAKVTRVEPSLQACFVDYGGNRHGFLAFSEIHPDYYRIPVADREALLAEQAAFERRSGPIADFEPLTKPRDRRGRDRKPAPRLVLEGPDEPAETLPTETFSSGIAPGDADSADRGADAADATDAGGELQTEGAAGEPEPAGEAHIESGAAEAAPVGDVRSDDAAAGEPAAGAGDIVAEAPIASAEAGVEVVSGEEDADAADDDRPRRMRLSRRYKIQEVVKRRQIMLVQVTKEERGNKGAALTTYLSLAGRYCVLMPNTDRGGGISRRISSPADRKRLKAVLEELEIPKGMAVIIRTAGAERSKAEIRRDYEYLLRLWDEIRELTLKSTAPALIYEEASLIKRAIRDMYTRDIEEIIVEGEEAYKAAKAFMKMLTPSHAKRVQQYKDPQIPLFHRYQVESQLDTIHNPVVQLKSGGYIVINQTEALVAIDVNSGRATRERNIEETALRTNLEAAEEVARQLRLRDLAGLIVIDFIDMEENRHNAAVERKLKECVRPDRARIQMGRISPFGLLELSRQRMRPSVFEASTQVCRFCRGTGSVRSTESTALHVLRSIEEEGIRQRIGGGMNVSVPTEVALYILNQKRESLAEIESRHALRVFMASDDSLVPPDFRVERLEMAAVTTAPAPVSQASAPEREVEIEEEEEAPEEAQAPLEPVEARAGNGGARGEEEDRGGRRRSRRRRRGRRDEGRGPEQRFDRPGAEPRDHRDRPAREPEPTPIENREEEAAPAAERPPVAAFPETNGEEANGERRRRRRGRRGGRRRGRRGDEAPGEQLSGAPEMAGADAEPEDAQRDWPIEEDRRSEAQDAPEPQPEPWSSRGWHDEPPAPAEARGTEPAPWDEPAPVVEERAAPEPEPRQEGTDRPLPLPEEEAGPAGLPSRPAGEQEPEAPEEQRQESGEPGPSGPKPTVHIIEGPAEEAEGNRRGWWRRLVK
jgi:ribonuclease E